LLPIASNVLDYSILSSIPCSIPCSISCVLLLRSLPIKRYDDQSLMPRALELRSKGLSYAAIARELGCSPGKVHDLLAPFESPKNRLEKLAELDLKISEIEKKVSDFSELLKKLRDEAEEAFKEVDRGMLAKMRGHLLMILFQAYRRSRKCKWVDGEGYCLIWRFHEHPSEIFDAKEAYERNKNGEMERVFFHNVSEAPGLCLSCPHFKPREVEKSG